MSRPLGMSFVISHPQSPPLEQQIALFAEVGFDSFFLSSGSFSSLDVIAPLRREADRCGIAFEAVHGFGDGLEAMWSDDNADRYLDTTRRTIDLCGAAGVPKLVLHPTCGAADYRRAAAHFLPLEEAAHDAGVLLCYENSINPAAFCGFMHEPHFECGFCYDAGHAMRLADEQDTLLEQFGGMLAYTHLHDNLRDGRDMHLMPYDGAGDYAAIAQQLKRSGYAGTVNLELSCYYSEAYRAMTFEQFTRRAYAAAQRLRAAIEQ